MLVVGIERTVSWCREELVVFRMFVNTRACMIQRNDSTFSESSNGEHMCMCTI